MDSFYQTEGPGIVLLQKSCAARTIERKGKKEKKSLCSTFKQHAQQPHEKKTLCWRHHRLKKRTKTAKSKHETTIIALNKMLKRTRFKT